MAGHIKYITEARSHRKCCRFTLTKLLATFSIIFIVILVVIIYRHLVLYDSEHMQDELLVKEQPHKYQEKIKQINLTSQPIMLLTGTNALTKHQIGYNDDDSKTFATVYNDAERLRLKHLRYKYFRHHRVARDLRDLLDPVQMQSSVDFANLYAKVRNKRARIALNKLEQEYTRCKKQANINIECVEAFNKMYLIAQDIGERLDRIKEIFQDSNYFLQHLNASSEVTNSSSTATTTAPIYNETITTDRPITGRYDKNTNNTTTKPSITSKSAAFKASTASQNAQNSTTTTTALPIETTTEIKPEKISWILDGNESNESQRAAVQTTDEPRINNTTTSTTVSAYTEHEQQPSTQSTPESDDKISWILDGNDNDVDSVELMINTTARNSLSNTSDELAHLNATTISSITATTNTMKVVSVISTTDTPTKLFGMSTNYEQIEMTTATATATTTTTSSSPTATTKSAPIKYVWIMDAKANAQTPADDDLVGSMENSTEMATSTPTQLKTLAFVVTNADVTVGYGGECSSTTIATTNCEPEIDRITTLPTTSATQRTDYEGHALDDPSSAENMLESFEREDQIKPLVPEHTEGPAIATSVPTNNQYNYDAKQLNHQLEEGIDAARMRTDEQEMLVDLFADLAERNVSKFGSKLNPANKNGFSASDVQFISLCERMAKRMRSKTGADISDKSLSTIMEDGSAGGVNPAPATASPAIQFTSRAPGDGFPVTGETIKASAQFMMNPNFMMPTIPICFYVTPSSFRIMNQPSMWMPTSFYGGSGGIGAGGGGGGGGGGGQSTMMGGGVVGGGGTGGHGGIFFIPQGAGGGTGGPTGGNFFSAGTAAGGQANIFSKNASPFKQQQQQQQQQVQRQRQQQKQQVYCTYMQQPPNNEGNMNQQNAGVVVGGGMGMSGPNNGFNGMSFTNANFKLRTMSNQNATTQGDIIYASYVTVPLSAGDGAITNGANARNLNCMLPDQVACTGNNQCIRKTSWCDGTVDCADGSDEATCTCHDRIPAERICDGYADCPMGEDEIGCFGCDKFMYSCYANISEYEHNKHSAVSVSMCYSALERCDGFQNCLSGRDEHDCSLIVTDVTHHMSHSVSSSAGLLYHNHRGEWYPVCNNADKWANDACEAEGIAASKPNVTFRELALAGPFIEPSLLGAAHFPQTCQQRNNRNALADYAAWVQCAPAQCGRVVIPQQNENMFKSNQQKSKRIKKAADVDEARIVGGSYSRPQQWPFAVAIYRNGNFHCGGSIYTQHWIITAAHCVIKYMRYYYEVHAGMWRRSSYATSTQIRTVSHVIVHQAYERRSMRNDLALLRVAEPLQFNRWVRPICLPAPGRTTNGNDWIWGPEEHTICTVVGWGAVREKGPSSDQLREVNVPIRKGCTQRSDQEAEGVCAGDAGGGRDACQGDSGGPLFCRSVTQPDEWYLAGVVSHGNGCARSGEFGVYTRVALFLDWLEMALRSEFLPRQQPQQLCPGYMCVWGGARCIPQRKRCDRIVDCLGGEDEVGCIYNFVPDVASALNTSTTTTTESDYFPADETSSETERNVARTNGQTKASLEINDAEFNARSETTTEGFKEATPSVTATSKFSVTTVEAIDKIISTTLTSVTVTNDADTTATITTITADEFDTDPETTTELIATTSPKTPFVLPTSTEAQQQLHELAAKVLQNLDENSRSTTPSTSPITKRSTTNEITSITEPPTTIPETPIASTTTTIKPKIEQSKMLEKFICTRIPQIIDRSHRCDRLADCEDGSDEENCSCRDYLKGPLDILVCDGKTDCEDLTDEENCGHCKLDEFLCPLSKTCIPLHKRCNNNIDCKFNEDEQHCFALTNGKEIMLDINKQPILSHVGIFSRNINGMWRAVCTHETSYHEHSAKTAADVCALFGFHGYKYYNTTAYIPHTIYSNTPIDPELAVQPEHRLLPSMLRSVDKVHQPQSPQKLRGHVVRLQNTANTPGVAGIQTCLGLYLECNPRLNGTKPLRALSAGAQVNPQQQHELPEFILTPTLETHGKPNVYATPNVLPPPIVKTKEHVLERLQRLLTERHNSTVLVHNQLHEAIDELHWPWLVDIYANGRLWCIGVLVDQNWVLVHESCMFAIRLNNDYVSALFGGGKTKHIAHKSPHEQISRIDCFEMVPNSNVLLYHLAKPVRYTHYVLPIFLPQLDGDFDENAIEQCISLMHDNQLGRIKSVAIAKHKDDRLCASTDLPCYRLLERQPANGLLLQSALSGEDFGSISEELFHKQSSINADADELLGQALSRFTLCTQFGTTMLNNSREPIDQGVIVCRNIDSGWYPMAMYDYNNTNCNSFNEAFSIRTLHRVYRAIETIIGSPKCGLKHEEPACSTHRCPLGACLSTKAVCNGHNDCHDGSDELPLTCLRQRTHCSASELTCRKSGRCVPKTKFCDHVPDCDDLTDEPTVCSCFTYLQATEPQKICDGIRNCWDKSDESPALCNCTDNHFTCGSSKECIPRDFVCDNEPDCPNGEDENYCFGIEQPLHKQHNRTTSYWSSTQNDSKRPPQYGQVIEQNYGIWHTKCFPRKSPPTDSEVRRICRQLGYNPYAQPSYRLIDDAAGEVVRSNEPPDMRGRSFSDAPLAGKYRDATKAMVVSKFSPLHLNDELTLFIKPSRPIAKLVRWNSTDSINCYRMEIRCA